jgi:lysophospholipase L1-like esterase
MIRIALAILAAAVTTVAVGCGQGCREKLMLENVRRIVFLGDSITYGGNYIDYLDACLATRLPDRRYELVNLGLPSETVSGLSEPGHAGGAFPRPDLHERLARALEKARPDLIVACYGMNDGIYYPFGQERFRAYQDGIRRLVGSARAAGAKVLLLTPPTFDPVPLKGRTLPAGRSEYRQPYEGYNEVLDRYAAWLLAEPAFSREGGMPTPPLRGHVPGAGDNMPSERRAGHATRDGEGSPGVFVADVHGPMNRHLAERRRDKPDYLLAGDGVHCSAFGHWLMAAAVLEAWGMPAEVDTAEIDATARTAARGRVTDLAADAEGIRFAWLTRLPMPMDPQWDPKSVELEKVVDRFNRHCLVVRGAPAARYQLYEDAALVGTLTREELAAGINLARLANLSTNRRSLEVLKLVHQRQRLLADAWLSDVGHKRPGMAKGLPLQEATQKAADLERQIRTLAAPLTLNLRLVAVK